MPLYWRRGAARGTCCSGHNPGQRRRCWPIAPRAVQCDRAGHHVALRSSQKPDLGGPAHRVLPYHVGVTIAVEVADADDVPRIAGRQIGRADEGSALCPSQQPHLGEAGDGVLPENIEVAVSAKVATYYRRATQNRGAVARGGGG